MKGVPWQNNAEGSLETGGSSSGESNTDNFQTSSSILRHRAAGGGQDLLEVTWKSNLANTPLLKYSLVQSRVRENLKQTFSPIFNVHFLLSTATSEIFDIYLHNVLICVDYNSYNKKNPQSIPTLINTNQPRTI